MNITRQERLECAHENNPYFIEAGKIARFDWTAMNADLVALATAREHLKQAIKIVSGMSDCLEDGDKEHVADCIEDALNAADDNLFDMVEDWSKQASEEAWGDA
jgi:hypothetical protein